MPRSASAGLLAKIAEDTTALATLVSVERRDGTTVYLTDFDTNLPLNGNLYVASEGYNRSKIEHRSGTRVDETELTALFGSSLIDPTDVANGRYDYSLVTIRLVYWPDLSLGSMIVGKGRIGRIIRAEGAAAKFVVRDISERLIGELGRKVTPECGWSLGDPKTCKIPLLPDDVLRSTAYVIGDFVKATVTSGSGFEPYGNVIFECTVAGTTGVSPPTFDTTPGNTTVDGTVTWKCYEAWTRNAVVTSATSKSLFNISVTESRAIDEWFTLGQVYFLTGNNVSGRPYDIFQWTQTGGLVELAIPVGNDILVGDQLRIAPGCDLVRGGHCLNKFVMAGSFRFSNGNAKRHGGFDSLPGRQFLHQNVHAGR